MSYRTVFFSIAIISGLSLFAQQNDVLLKIGDEEVNVSEFERIYKKNNNENSLNRQTPEEYLELFINFKLKVLEAEALGMDTTQKFIKELDSYISQLAKPYLTDSSAKEKIIKEAYERAKEDINASHILITIDQKAAPEDTLLKYNKVMEIRQRIIDGEPFEKVAKATSEDASVKRNGGNLNYFTVFTMIYPFETAAYNTPVGGTTMPVRTSFGYHIIKINDRRPARGQIKVAHIFVRLPEGISETEKTEAWKKINMAYDSLQAGVDYATVVKEFSEDPNSARSGGEMPWFGTGRMIAEFEDACYAIENNGDYTKPVKTFFGWHIIKLVDKKPVGSFEEMKPGLTEKINRGDRAKYESELFINNLKSEYGFEVNKEALLYFADQLDSTIFISNWKVPESLETGLMLFSIGEKNVTIGEFASYVIEKQSLRKPYSLHVYTDDIFKKYSDKVIMKYEEEQLPEKYPDFRYIVEEYHDGILLFDIMDNNVWSKAVKDTTGLEQFHNTHQNDYMWGSRADAIIIECDSTVNEEAVRKLYKKIIKGKAGEDYLNQKFCLNDTIPCIKIVPYLVEEGSNAKIDELNMKVGIGDSFSENGLTKFVIVRDIKSPEPKLLNESRGQITSDYQNHLEKEWINELKVKYPVEVNEELLNKIQ